MLTIEAVNPPIIRFSLNHERFVEDSEKLSIAYPILYRSFESALLAYSGISWNRFIKLTKAKLLESKFDGQSDIYSLKFCNDEIIVWAEVDAELIILTSIHQPRLN